jgi:DinB superfamily
MSPAEIAPDTKDWTWVLARPCPECGYRAGEVEPAELADRLRRNAERWQDVLQRGGARDRPAPDVWSPAEYGCHVRDVHRTMAGRVRLMLEQDAPSFPDWDQDATAVEQRYAEQESVRVAGELVEAAQEVAALYEGVSGAAWDRTGQRSNGSGFTVAGLGRYHLHDVVHHLHDVGA